MMSSRGRRPPRAQLTIAPLPNVRGGWRYTAECAESASTMLYIPGAMDPLPVGAFPLIVGWLHSEECGACDVEPVLARGDQSIRTQVDRLELLLAVRERTN
jgi:hypothetical protein